MKNQWTDRMKAETDAAEQAIPSDDKFAPTGARSDLNTLAADLMADPDPDLDPFRNGAIT